MSISKFGIRVQKCYNLVSEFMERERTRLKESSTCPVVWYVPYGLQDPKKNPNGVNNLVSEGIPHLEGKGYKITTVAPSLADNTQNIADFNLGKALPFPKWWETLSGTSSPFSLPFPKRLATELYFEKEPQIVILEEPFMGLGPHSMLLGMPTREDRKPVALEVARFHAGIYSYPVEVFLRQIFRVGKAFRRPEFNRNGAPNGRWTKGVVNTLLNDLELKIAVSKATAEASKRRYGKDGFEVVYDGIDTSEFTPDRPIGPNISAWKEDKKKIVLLAMGRMERRKDYKTGIEAFRRVRQVYPNVKLVVAGDGTERKNLEKQAENLPDVHFVDILPLDEYKEMLIIADVALCTARAGEGFGLVPARTLASSTPVVLTRTSGYNEVVDNGQPFALMAEPRNPDDFAKKTIEILNWSEETRGRMRREAAEYIRRRFDWKVVAVQLDKLFTDVLKRHGPADWAKAKEIYRKERGSLPTSGDIFVAG